MGLAGFHYSVKIELTSFDSLETTFLPVLAWLFFLEDPFLQGATDRACVLAFDFTDLALFDLASE